jgi:hypothetical protein
VLGIIDSHLDPVEAIDADDSTVILEIRVQMRKPGAYDDDIYAHLWTIRNGKAEWRRQARRGDRRRRRGGAPGGGGG